jgi:hypothetical protein
MERNGKERDGDNVIMKARDENGGRKEISELGVSIKS